jgi:hypothetical protein
MAELGLAGRVLAGLPAFECRSVGGFIDPLAGTYAIAVKELANILGIPRPLLKR